MLIQIFKGREMSKEAIRKAIEILQAELAGAASDQVKRNAGRLADMLIDEDAGGFDWEETPQGEAYWSDVHDNLTALSEREW